MFAKYKRAITLLLCVACTIQIFAPTIVSAASLQDQLNALNAQIAQIDGQKKDLQKQIDSNNYTINAYNSQLSQLYAEKQLYEDQAKELELQINALEIQIEQINNDITKTQSDIKDTEGNISQLEKESNSRIQDSYYNFRMYGDADSTTVLEINNINSYFKTTQYKEIMQSDTNDLLSKLASLKQDLQDKESDLNDKLIQVKKDKEVVDVKKIDLDKKRDEAYLKALAYESGRTSLVSANNQVKNQIEDVSKDEADKRRLANQIQQQLFNQFTSISSGQYVTTGTLIGRQGCTGLCTGPHLHFMVTVNGKLQNPCAWLKGGVCGYGNRLDWPLKPVVHYTSGYGNRCFQYGNNPHYCDFHNGIDIIGTTWNAPVYSAQSGYLFKGRDPYGANYIIICENRNCNVGVKTGYWHLSSF